jgi:hypothetical protein
VGAIDPKTLRRISRTVVRTGLGATPTLLTAGAGAVWLSNTGDLATASLGRGTVWRLDPRTKRIVARIALPRAPLALAPDRGRLWIADSSGTLRAVPPAPSSASPGSARRMRAVAGCRSRPGRYGRIGSSRPHPGTGHSRRSDRARPRIRCLVSNWCGPPARVVFHVLLPGGERSAAWSSGPRCDAPGYPSTVTISPYGGGLGL